MIANPEWLLIGLVLTLIGFLLVRWTTRRDGSRELNDAARSAAIDVLKGAAASKDAREQEAKLTVASNRQDLLRFAGVVGFLLLISGLLMTAFGLFGT
jgi:hypothetical protein